MVKIDQIKELREQTGLSISEVKKALEDAKGDVKEAKELLRALGKKIADKKIDKETGFGLIESYVHSDSKSGVLLDVRCESDFVARSSEFKNLAHEICLQITAMNPLDETSLLSQPWIRDDSKTIKNLIEDIIAKVGEKIEVKKFARFEI